MFSLNIPVFAYCNPFSEPGVVTLYTSDLSLLTKSYPILHGHTFLCKYGANSPVTWSILTDNAQVLYAISWTCSTCATHLLIDHFLYWKQQSKLGCLHGLWQYRGPVIHRGSIPRPQEISDPESGCTELFPRWLFVSASFTSLSLTNYGSKIHTAS